MLTNEQIQNNKMKYLELLGKLEVDLTPFYKYLENIDYFNKPASAQYKGSYRGGLCEQAVKLCYELGNLCNAYCPGQYTSADIIKVALLKDLYRAEMYEEFTRNVKNETTGQWEATQAFRIKDERPTFGDVGFSSYMIAKYFFELTDEQIEAICHADVDNFIHDLRDVMRSYKLVSLTHMAAVAVNCLYD